nr:hypothetical protein [uncultured Agathobaculum sp.]
MQIYKNLYQETTNKNHPDKKRVDALIDKALWAVFTAMIAFMLSYVGL